MELKSMDNPKNDSYYFQKSLEELGFISQYMKCIDSYDDFLQSGKCVDAIMFRLIQLVEHIKNISPEFKSIHNEIPWGNIIGFRNGIVHEYGQTDYTVVYKIITVNLDQLRYLFLENLK